MSRYRIGCRSEVALGLLWCTIVAPLTAAQPYNVSLVWQLPGFFNAVQVVDHYAYIGGNTWTSPQMLAIFEVSNPSSPVELGTLSLPDTVMSIQVIGGLAYTANMTGGLQIVDVTNPTSPTLRGSYPTRYVSSSVFVSGRLAYVAEDLAGLQIVDVTNPSSPTLRCYYRTPDYAADVSVHDGLAYIASGDSGLLVVDVADPSSPTIRGSYQDPSGGRIWNVFVSNGVAYVTATTGDYWSGYYGRLITLDVTNPAAPRVLGSYGTPGAAAGLYVAGGFAYAILGGGLCILDISIPSRPRLRGSYSFYPLGWVSEGEGRVFATGDLVYVAPGYGGAFMILQFTPPPLAANHWQLYR